MELTNLEDCSDLYVNPSQVVCFFKIKDGGEGTTIALTNGDAINVNESVGQVKASFLVNYRM